MRRIVEKWNGTSLILRIAVGLAVGALLGMACSQLSAISVLGNVFVGALKGIAPVLVFVLVISALANAKNVPGKQFRTVIFLYMFTTLVASVLAVIASFAFPVTLILSKAAEETAPTGVGEVLGNMITNMVQNPVSAILNANYIGILAWAIVFGLALKKVASDQTKGVLTNIADAVSTCVRWIISLAPFGIMGLVFTTVSENGLSVFCGYGKLLTVLLGCMILMALVINPMIIAVCLKKNPYPLVFKCLKESGITAFFTRSSAAITIAVMTLAAANTLGISVDIPTVLLLSLLATVAACGASGVAGGSLLLIPMACSLFGISNDVAMQVVGVGFIIGVLQDSLETALNSAGDVEFAATAEYMQMRKEGKSIDFKWEK